MQGRGPIDWRARRIRTHVTAVKEGGGYLGSLRMSLAKRATSLPFNANSPGLCLPRFGQVWTQVRPVEVPPFKLPVTKFLRKGSIQLAGGFGHVRRRQVRVSLCHPRRFVTKELTNRIQVRTLHREPRPGRMT